MARAGAASGEAKPGVKGEASGPVVKADGVEMAGRARGANGPLINGLERTVGTPWPVGVARTERGKENRTQRLIPMKMRNKIH